MKLAMHATDGSIVDTIDDTDPEFDFWMEHTPPGWSNGYVRVTAVAPDQELLSGDPSAPVQAHLPGQHDQKSHGRRGGASALLDKDAPSEAREQALRETWTVSHAESGMRSEVTDVTLGKSGGGRARGIILDEQDQEVGHFSYSVYDSAFGAKPFASIERIHIDEGHRGQGFAHALNQHAEGRYREAGIESVHLRTEDIGTYAWAKAGFDFNNRGREAPRFVSALQATAPTDPTLQRWASGEHPSALDIAMFGYAPGLSTWPGREVLLNSDTGWEGVKWL